MHIYRLSLVFYDGFLILLMDHVSFSSAEEDSGHVFFEGDPPPSDRQVCVTHRGAMIRYWRPTGSLRAVGRAMDLS